MNIAQLFLKFLLTVNIEIVIALLPEARRVADQSAGHALLQRLDGDGERFALWFAHQQVHMIGHNNVSIDAKQKSAAHTLDRSFKNRPCRDFGKVRPAMPAGEGDEMRLSGIVEALEPGWHLEVRLLLSPLKQKHLSGPPATRPPATYPS